MTVYFAFVPSAGNGQWPVRMEFSNNLEVPQRLLRERARFRRSRTFYDGHVRLAQGGQPEEEFPDADMSAFMLVWRRRSAAPVPGLAQAPDEVWSLSALGAVVRERYSPVEPEVFRPAPERERRRPGARPRVRRAAAVAVAGLATERLATERRVWLAPVDENRDVVVVREVVAPPRPSCPSCDVVPDVNGRCGCS
ncbi:hypothetical protein [Streptomyces albogriseolus]|uniref:hypothetical protein n=1 Tax=Streptomyces albogriseolus TaxID=1887 RepID=UPI0034605F25